MINRAAIDDACFDAFGEDGTYTPVGGGVTGAAFIVSAPDEVISLGPRGAIVPNVVAQVRISEWAEPARGDAVTVLGANYTVSTVQRHKSKSRWVLGLDEAP